MDSLRDIFEFLVGFLLLAVVLWGITGLICSVVLPFVKENDDGNKTD